MTSHGQTLAALGVVALAVAYLVTVALKKRAKPGCGGDCGCPASELKAKLRK
jgi:hypothetical protein